MPVGAILERLQVSWPPALRAKYVTDLVDPNLAADVPAPGHETVSASFVFVSECPSVTPPLGQRAELRHLHQPGPQAFAIDG